jgi:hypothetical protein
MVSDTKNSNSVFLGHFLILVDKSLAFFEHVRVRNQS